MMIYICAIRVVYCVTVSSWYRESEFVLDTVRVLCHQVAKAKGKFKVIDSGNPLTTEDIVKRIIENRFVTTRCFACTVTAYRLLFSSPYVSRLALESLQSIEVVYVCVCLNSFRMNYEARNKKKEQKEMRIMKRLQENSVTPPAQMQ